MRLLALDSEGIKKLLDSMEKDCIDIKNDSLKMSWFMRGGISYTDILNLSIEERKSISKIIEDNLETTKNSQLPFF
jgi:hypothetical protein